MLVLTKKGVEKVHRQETMKKKMVTKINQASIRNDVPYQQNSVFQYFR